MNFNKIKKRKKDSPAKGLFFNLGGAPYDPQLRLRVDALGGGEACACFAAAGGVSNGFPLKLSNMI